jgi:hypothetical protein
MISCTQRVCSTRSTWDFDQREVPIGVGTCAAFNSVQIRA